MSVVTVIHRSGSPLSARHHSFSQASTSLSFGAHRPGRATAALRLTRRGRLVFIGLPLMLLAAGMMMLAVFLNAPAQASSSVSDLGVTATVPVTVQSGQSLWSIAAAVVPERDTRDVIADIVQLNNLSAADVHPGQELFVPAN
ncbi:LysM peptidoglycan-binding domain-containing protein [Pseudarthrobacter sp. PS3-L1]|uniref:LysM peptidoglycan-binding domain-containing protein n=1 Tax=Pseudarthrobacter sp. PS3-L1 TaxID=3046207 RepID=UPI0024BAB28A|nr:LysM peptidoglycan-binding domain-containing protein [Pseudarthrobacter sp. PS3-L1]MDJ0321905.1 LysM peptidoglycan-binding domain-containing protein [Pseudarthrobacter sp. PS3-L1]